MLVINPLVEGHEALLPDVRRRDVVDHLATIGEVCVHHMLDKQVLDKVDKVTVEGDRVGVELLGERLVLGNVVLVVEELVVSAVVML